MCSRMNNANEELIPDEHVRIDKILQKVQDQQHVQEQQQVHEHESSMSDTASDDETSEDGRIMDGTPTGTVVPRRSSRQTHPPVKFRDYALMISIMNVVEPLNYEQAKYKEEWVTAMNEEYNSIMRNKTWDLA